MDMTQGSHDPVDIMGKIASHFIDAFWCAILEVGPEKDWTPRKQGLCGYAVSLVPVGNETNVTKGLRYQDAKFRKNQQPGRAFTPVNSGTPCKSPACCNMIAYNLPEFFLE